jgi:hypothetical protein
MPDDPKPKKVEPAKPRLEELIEQAAKPGQPESPRDFVQRRMRELDSESEKES